MTESSLTATLLANGPYARADAPFELVDVNGPDAGPFLHRLCSQDVLGLAEGEVAPAAFLNAKGKVQLTVLVWPTDEGFRLETQRVQADALVESLQRYHFSEQLTITRVEAAGCHELVAAATDPLRRADTTSSGCRVAFARRGVQFVRSYGDASTAEAAPLPDDLAEALRMAAGLVRIGVETERTTVALEADLDDHCSAKKGCYTGQEVIARLRTYGGVNRKLCLLRMDAGDAIDAPTTLLELEDEIPVGRVLHAISVSGHDGRVGLGYLPRDFQALGTELKLEDGGAVEVVGFADA